MKSIAKVMGAVRTTGRFAANSSGSIAIPFGLTLVMVAASIGGAVDFNRWHSARRTTMDALDAAVLAGARAVQLNPGNTQVALDTATAYFQRNIESRVDFSVNNVTFVLADNNQALTATGAAKINASFLRLLGMDELTVVSDTGAGLPKAKLTTGGSGGSNIEISLVLDVTGSMCNDSTGPCTSSTKMDGLKSAANRLIDMVVSTNQNNYTSRMAIVPFSSNVRVGPDGGGWATMKLLTDLNPLWTGWRNECQGWTQLTGGGGGELNWGSWECTGGWVPVHKVNWKVAPCVTDRFYDNIWDLDYTDNAPGSGRWLNSMDGNRMPKSWDSSNTAPTSGTGQTPGDPAGFNSYNDTGYCWDSDQANEIMPLSSDITALKAKIDGLVAYGPTAGALGTAWGWYLMSPRWSSIWTGQKRPGNYSDLTSIQTNGRPLLRKVAIIMSDGVYNTYRGWAGNDRQQLVSDYAKQLCTNMKAEGIEIFTVGLALDQLTATERAIAEDTLRSCGTDVSHFYATFDVQELQQAFQDIAYQLSGITLTR